MSTLSLRKIKHDSSSVDNIITNTDGGVGLGGIDPSTLPGFIDHAVKVQNGGGLGIQSTNAADNRWIFFGNGTSSGDVQRAGIVNQGSDQSLALATAGTQRLIVDSLGRVTMPFQPSFEVGGTGGLTFTAVGASEYKLTYASVYHNIGNHYSTSTGHFTAPVTGSYLFQAVMMGVNSTSPHITFSINGSAQGGGGNYPNNNLYEHGSYSQNAWWIRTIHIFRLQANDYVRVQSYAYNSVSSPDRCYFGGHLLG